MKQLLLLLLLLLLLSSAALPAAAQQPACKTMRMGIFRMTSPGELTTRIIRSGSRQTELMSNSTQQTDYTVEWLDDCTYVLIPRASVFDKYPLMPRDARLTVRITQVTGASCTTESTFNFSKDVIRGKLTKVK